ncbi:fucose isomerase [Candidatus Heimdallarchaeota archaeon]|nr:MAG: fucose isomerase [Candidatus Heimdallarchaeota archaeon]
MLKEINIGVVCLARKTFDYVAAKNLYFKIQEQLEKIASVNWSFISELVIEIADARKAAKTLKEKHIDGLVVISGTFALGHLVLELHKTLKSPILLWGLEELPYDGGKIRLNSVCGVNLNSSNLYKAGVKNYHTIIGPSIDNDWLGAIRIKKALSETNLGLIGYRAQGFFNLDIDELDLYKKLGLLINHYELESIFRTKVEKEKVEKRKRQVEELFDLSDLSPEQTLKVAELTAKFDHFIEKNNLTCLAIRCWPEFAASFGISPCAAMSILQAEEKIIACEGDALGALSMVAHQAIGAKTPFLADFSQVDFQENHALLWHCGVAPYNLWDEKCTRSLDSYFAGGKGVTADFVMKDGGISIARLDYAPGEYRIFLQEGQAVPMDKELKGTYMKVIFEENVRTVLKKIIGNGIAHHVSVVYGKFLEPFRIFARINNWEIIE